MKAVWQRARDHRAFPTVALLTVILFISFCNGLTGAGPTP